MPTVKVYSTPTCPYCVRLKEYLKQHNIEFDNIDVSKDKASVDEMVRISGQMGVPVTSIDGEIVVGFDRERIDTALGIN